MTGPGGADHDQERDGSVAIGGKPQATSGPSVRSDRRDGARGTPSKLHAHPRPSPGARSGCQRQLSGDRGAARSIAGRVEKTYAGYARGDATAIAWRKRSGIAGFHITQVLAVGRLALAGPIRNPANRAG